MISSSVAKNEPSFSKAAKDPTPEDPAAKDPATAAARASKNTTAQSTKRGTGDKRERILRAAIKVFARKGFYATRVSEIAKAAGVADGTIYLYFKNKDAVLVSIFEDRMAKLLKALQDELALGGTVEARIRRVIELQLGLLESRRDLAEVITVNLRQSSRLLKQYAAPLFSQYLEVIAEVFAEGQREGVVRPDLSPLILARALWGGLDGLALTWTLTDGKDENLRKAAQQFADVFLGGVIEK